MRVTKYVITSSESDILPSDIAMKIYGSKYDVNVKETCFGVIINGEEDVIKSLVEGDQGPGPMRASSSRTADFLQEIPGAAGVAEAAEQGRAST